MWVGWITSCSHGQSQRTTTMRGEPPTWGLWSTSHWLMKASKSSGCTSPALLPNATSSLEGFSPIGSSFRIPSGDYIWKDMGPDFPTHWLHKSQVENLVILIIGSVDMPRSVPIIFKILPRKSRPNHELHQLGKRILTKDVQFAYYSFHVRAWQTD